MSWDSLSALLFQCMEGGEVPRPVLVLGAVGTLASVLQALFTLYRWLKRRRADGTHSAAAALLRREGEYRVALNHRPQAMANFNMSVELNPNGGECYYQRGLLRESLWLAHRDKRTLNRALADWKSCLRILPGHPGATARLAHYKAPPPVSDPGWLGPPILLRMAGAVTVLAVLVVISLTQPGRALLELAFSASALP